MKIHVDTVAGNVTNFDHVLAEIRTLTGLKPFLRFELETQHQRTPVAIVQCGGCSLEFLGHVEGHPPSGASHIARVVLEIPGCDPVERELEPGLALTVRPGPKSRLAEIHVYSSAVNDDVAVLESCCAGVESAATADGGSALSFGDVIVRFLPLVSVSSSYATGEAGVYSPGWHRFALACNPLTEAVGVFAPKTDLLVAPYQVLPGLREAMFKLPSGVVIQPVEQKLWKMLPYMAFRSLAARVRGKPLRFGVKAA